MRRLLLMFSSLVLTSPLFADVSIDPLMNKITLQLSAEQWVTSKTALVTVGVNASVNAIGLDKIQSQVLDKLSRISNKGEWHIVSFVRSQDKSGLESVQISAQARIINSELSGLRDRAKSISKPGETYTVDDIQFTPTEDEIRDANNKLRTNIYEQAKAEIARLSTAYPDQKYYFHDINFVSSFYPAAMAQNMLYGKANENAPVPKALSVGDKLSINATVVLASSPDPNLVKLINPK